MKHAQKYESTSRWLVVRLGHLGDVVLTTGVLSYLGATRGWTFDVLVRKEWAEVYIGHPYVTRVVPMGAQDLAPASLLSFFRTVAAEHAGWGLLDLHGNLRSRLLATLWRGPVAVYKKMSVARRIFLAAKGRWCKEALLRFSVPQRYALAVLPTTPEPSELLPLIRLSEEEKAWGRARLDALCGSGSTPVGLHPFATHSLKAWPPAYFRALGDMLDARGTPWVALGRGEALWPERETDLTNKTSLRETCAVLAHCKVLVTGDSGPMHLAGGVGTPVLALFGPTAREWGFYPAGPQDIIMELPLPCRPCSLHGRAPCPCGGECLTRIRPEQVFQKLEAEGRLE